MIYLWSFNGYSVTITIEERGLIYFFGLEAHFYKSNPQNRKGSAPFITCDTIRTVANWYIDETRTPIVTEEMQPGDIVFVNRFLLDEFISQVNPHINTPYILITADTDDDSIATPMHSDLLKNPNLAIWASINCIHSEHPKAIPLPIGILPVKETKPLYEEVIKLSKNRKKNLFCIVNFADSTWTHVDRERVINDIKNFPFITFTPKVPLKEYLQTLSDSCFCICPRGCGWDCYRNWEALLVGSIPILEHSILDPLFYDLPVLIIEDFKMLNEDYLKSKFVQIKAKSYNYEKIYSHYWTNFLLSMQEKLRKGQNIDRDIQIFKKKTFGIESQKIYPNK